MTSLRLPIFPGLIFLLGLTAGRIEAQLVFEAEPNYMFAAVLGSGVYQIEDSSLTVVRVPLSMRLDETTPGEGQWNLLLPFTVGYASLDPDDAIDSWLPSEFGSFSFIPGIEYRKQVGDHLLLKPFAQLGGGYDFNNDTVSGLVVGGARAIWSIDLNKQWDLRLGTSIQWATEWRESGRGSSSFGLYELGFDLRRQLPWSICNRCLNGSVYGLWRHFGNGLNIANTPSVDLGVDDLFEIGFSVGADEGIDLFGYDLRRVSIGWVTGSEVNAITFGTSFPF